MGGKREREREVCVCVGGGSDRIEILMAIVLKMDSFLYFEPQQQKRV